MNKHIELVKKWLDDPSSVTTEELKANANAASDAASAAVTALTDAAYDAAYDAVIGAVLGAGAAYLEDTAKCVKRYEELTGGSNLP